MVDENRMAILRGAMERTALSKIEPVPKTLNDLVAFLMHCDPQHHRAVRFQIQRTSPVWWLEYALDGLFRRGIQGLQFVCLNGMHLRQDGLCYGKLKTAHVAAETRRRLIAAINALPLTTRVSVESMPYEGDPVVVHHVTSLGAIVQATRKQQAKTRFDALQERNLDDLAALLDGDSTASSSIGVASSSSPPLPLSEAQRPTERIITLLGDDPSRLYYVLIMLISFLFILIAYYLL